MREELSRELEGLIHGYLEETLADEEARRLREMLKGDERHLDEFLRVLDCALMKFHCHGIARFRR